MLIVFVALFFGGAFFVNSIPHLVAGVQGRKFPTPFAKPPGRGESSTIVNVLWAFFNLAIADVLLFHVASFDPHSYTEVLAFGLGGLLIALHLAYHFGKVLR